MNNKKNFKKYEKLPAFEKYAFASSGMNVMILELDSLWMKYLKLFLHSELQQNS